MRLKVLVTLIAAVMISMTAQNAEAGALRYLGKRIKGGTNQVAQSTVVPAAKETQAAGKATSGAVSTAVDKTKNGAETAAGAVAAAGTATGSAAKTGALATRDGTVAVANGVKATPGVVAQGTESLGKKIWHVIY
ncbi:MAG TPA: hypothetical protein VG204_22240 [Terriglobia bacterium]|nr:hypothetical protein [Terriglobia bacterium]